MRVSQGEVNGNEKESRLGRAAGVYTDCCLVRDATPMRREQ